MLAQALRAQEDAALAAAVEHQELLVRQVELPPRTLHQATKGRMHILGIMGQAIAEPPEDISPYAPRISTMQINPEETLPALVRQYDQPFADPSAIPSLAISTGHRSNGVRAAERPPRPGGRSCAWLKLS